MSSELKKIMEDLTEMWGGGQASFQGADIGGEAAHL